VWELRYFDREWVRHEPSAFVNATGHSLPEVTFPERYGHAGVHWEHEGQAYLVFHGGVAEGYVSNDVLLFNLATKVWEQRNFITAPFRAFHSLHVGAESLAVGAPRHLLALLGFGHDKINIGANFATAEPADTNSIVALDLELLKAGPSDAKWKAWQMDGAGVSPRLAAGVVAMDANKVLALGGFRCDEDAKDRVPHLANVTDTNCGDVFEDAWVLQVSVPPDAMATVVISVVDAAGEPLAPQNVLISLSGTPITEWEGKGAGSVAVPVGELLIECVHDGVLVAELRQFVAGDTAVSVRASSPLRASFQLLRLDRSSPFQDCAVVVEARSVLTQAWRTLPFGSLRTSEFGYVAFDVHPSKLSLSANRWGEYRLSAFEGGLKVVSAAFQADVGEVCCGVVVGEVQNRAGQALELREEELLPGFAGGVRAVEGALEALQYSYVDVVFRDLEKWHEAQVNVTFAAAGVAEPGRGLEAEDLRVYQSADLRAFPNNSSSPGDAVERVECEVAPGDLAATCVVRRWDGRSATPYLPIRLGIAHERPELDSLSFNLTAQIVTAASWKPPEEPAGAASEWSGAGLLAPEKATPVTTLAAAVGGATLVLAALAALAWRRRKKAQTVLDSSPPRGPDTTWTGVGLGLSAAEAGPARGPFGQQQRHLVGGGGARDEEFMGNLERLASEYRENLAAAGAGAGGFVPPPPPDSTSGSGADSEAGAGAASDSESG